MKDMDSGEGKQVPFVNIISKVGLKRTYGMYKFWLKRTYGMYKFWLKRTYGMYKFWLKCTYVCTNFGLNVHTPVYKKAPNDLKTLPMGILHDYMSCWTTRGPFRYPQGTKNGPKQHQK